MRVETLVAMYYDSEPYGDLPKLERLLTRMGNAVVAVTHTTYHGGRPERDIPVHRIAFNSDELRNTHAHGMGCDCGFVVHVES